LRIGTRRKLVASISKNGVCRQTSASDALLLLGLDTQCLEQTMQRRFTVFLLGFLAIAVYSVPELSARAQGVQHLDLVIIIDTSGSMVDPQYGQSDPHNLRYVAAKMLIDLVSDQDRIGIVHFSRVSHPLSNTLMPMDTPDRRQELKQRLDDARRTDKHEGTNYTAALSDTWALLKDGSTNRRAVIFLTDGIPDEGAEGMPSVLKPFREAGIPVFLMLLRNKLPYDESALGKLERAFQATGPTPTELTNPQDIAGDFAFAITQLQPDLYYDPLVGIPYGVGQLKYEVEAGSDQEIQQATFVFVPAEESSTFDVPAKTAPPGAPPRIGGDNSYRIISYAATYGQFLTGHWIFTAIPSNTKAFAFLRSTVRLQLTFPFPSALSGQRVVASHQSVLLGVHTEGLPADAASSIVAATSDASAGGCFQVLNNPQGDVTYQLDRRGLSSDSTLFWKAIGPREQPFLVSISLGQIDKPLRLRRCFSVGMLGTQIASLGIVRPTAADTLENGAIPLQVSLPAGAQWKEIYAYVQAPDQRVTEVALPPDNPHAAMGGLTASGTYTIRFVAQGTETADTSNPITLFAETHYEVSENLGVPKSIDLGKFKDLNTPLTDEIRIDAPFVTQETKFDVRVTATRNISTGQLITTGYKFDLCPSGPTIQSHLVRCPFILLPTSDLSPGKYESTVQIAVQGQTNTWQTTVIRYERPTSLITLPGLPPGSGIMLSSLTPDRPILSTTLRFTPYFWQGNPDLPTDIQASDVHDIDHDKTVPPNAVQLQLQPMALPEDLVFVLSLKATPQLEHAHYKVRVPLAPGPHAPNLRVNPGEIILFFDYPGAVITMEFAGPEVEYPDGVWGLPELPTLLPGLFPTSTYLHVPVITQNLVQMPPLPPPNILQVRKGEASEDPSAVQLSWHDDGPVAGTPHTYHASLLLTLAQPLPAGTHTIRVQLPAPISDPQEVAISIHVLGWNDFVWQRLLPALLMMIVAWTVIAAWIRNHSKAFRGKLMIDQFALPLHGKYDLQIVLNEADNFDLRPDEPNSEVVVRCRNQQEIEIDFKDGEPLTMRLGDAIGRLAYIK
jgi:hypothetical protein